MSVLFPCPFGVAVLMLWGFQVVGHNCPSCGSRGPRVMLGENVPSADHGDDTDVGSWGEVTVLAALLQGLPLLPLTHGHSSLSPFWSQDLTSGARATSWPSLLGSLRGSSLWGSQLL